MEVLHDQRRSVAPVHRDLEQLGGGVPDAVGRRSRGGHLGERHELLAVGEPATGQSYELTGDVSRFRGPPPSDRSTTPRLGYLTSRASGPRSARRRRTARMSLLALIHPSAQNGAFSEARMHDPASVDISEPRGQRTGIFEPGGRNQHLVVLDGYSAWRMLGSLEDTVVDLVPTSHGSATQPTPRQPARSPRAPIGCSSNEPGRA